MNLTTPGIYQCVVGGAGPQTLTYSVNGGMGGGYSSNATQGGRGASLGGTMNLTGGQTIYITVGSNGVSGVTWPIPQETTAGQTGSSGGGYSAVSLSLSGSPIVVAGGGGGGGSLIAPGGASVPSSSHGAGAGGTYSGSVGAPGGILSTAGGGGEDGGGSGGTPTSGGANSTPGYGAGGGGAGFGQTVGGNGDAQTSQLNGYQFTTWNSSPVPYGGGGGGGLWGGGGGGGWAGGGGGGGTSTYWSANGGGGGGGSSLLATANTAGITATQTSAASDSTAGAVSLTGTTCNLYRVTYMANGGTGSVPVDDTWYSAGANATVLAGSLTGPASAPYFIGWSTTPTGAVQYAAGSLVNVTGPVTLWAVYSPGTTVNFNGNAPGVTGTMTPQTTGVPTALTPNSFFNQGYGFLGWNTAANGTGTFYADDSVYPFTTANQSVTLYAQWAEIMLVSFNPNGGSWFSPDAGAQGDIVIPQTGFQPAPLNPGFPIYPPNPGQVLSGWNSAQDGSGATYQIGQVFPFNADLYLWAQWQNAGTVIFVPNGGTGAMPNQQWYTTTTLDLNTFTPPAGSKFGSWNTQADGSGTSYADGANFPFVAGQTQALYAHWVPDASTTYTVTFDANGGTGSMAPQSSATAAPLAANTFTRGGYTFTGWNTAANGSGTSYANGATYPFTASTTLYAQWRVADKVVVFLANGGAGGAAAQLGNAPTALRANTFTRRGHTFTGWNTQANGSGTAYANGAVYAFAADLTLYAQWTVTPAVSTVTFNSNGGVGTMAPQSASTPTALNANAFTYVGRSFVAWNTAANGSGVTYVNQGVFPFTSSATLYAQWSAAPPPPPPPGPTPSPSYTVTFQANGGTGTMSPQTASSPATLMPTAFTRAGFAFAGWNTSADGSGVAYANGATYSFTANLTLYAQWAQRPPVVTGLRVDQVGLGEVSASWKPLVGSAATFEVTLLDDEDISVGNCTTALSSCRINSVLPGRYTAAVVATVGSVTGKPALRTVTVTNTKPILRGSWRGGGKESQRAYATVALASVVDPAKVLVWTLVRSDGRTVWASRPAIRDRWTCRYTAVDIVCTWDRAIPTQATVKFSANGLFTKVASFPRPKRS